MPDAPPLAPAIEGSSQPGPPCPIEPQFSRAVTVLSAVVLITGMAAFAWLQLSIPRLDRVPSPERAVALMVGRMMDLEEAVTQAPAWEQQLYEFTSGGRAYELAQAIAWFEELSAASPDSLLILRLAVLHAEAGNLGWLETKVTDWKARPEPFASYARFLRGGYLESRLDPDNEQLLQAELAEILPAGWFYDRLALNLAMRGGDRALLAATQRATVARGQPLLKRSRVLAVVESAVIVIGCLILTVGRLRRHTQTPSGLPQVGQAPVPPSWRGRTGMAVLLRGGALGIVLIFILLNFGTDDPLTRLAAIPLTNLPILLLSRVYLFREAGRGFRAALGLMPKPEGWRRFGLAVPAVMAAGLSVEWGIDRVAELFNHASHWTEWFDADLVWGPLPILGLSLLEYVVLAPLFEEFVFRGLLFATLRRRFGPGASALLSATVFAAAHGYGFLGFASVLWSGIIWAWAYEKTGSLLPGMAAHALNNLLVCLTLVALLRW